MKELLKSAGVAISSSQSAGVEIMYGVGAMPVPPE